MPPLITLTTDFGTCDAYVAAMKGVILSLTPGARLVDVTHSVQPQDVMGAGWVLRQTIPYFPAGTIHLAVVDPGVGTRRRAIAARTGEHVFVGPDNGLLSLLLGPECLGPEEPDELVVLDRPPFWRTRTPSSTFHGRDIFAAVAAHLAAGRRLDEVGSPAARDSLVRLRWVEPLADEQGVQGWIVHVDRFGNAVSNVPASLIERYRRGRGVRCYAGSAILEDIHSTYGDVDPGEPIALIGSSGHLELGIHGGDAAALLSLARGTPVNVVFVERR